MTAATGRDDSTVSGSETFTAAYTGTNLVEYRTNRTASGPAALDVARLYLIDNADADRIVVTGPDYASEGYLQGQATKTLSYAGRLTAPQLLTAAGGTTHADTRRFTLDIVVATSSSATFNIAGTDGTSVFTIDDGVVNLGTGRLTIGSGTATTLTEATEALAQTGTFGFAGQIYGATADAVGGTYWGLANGSAAFFDATDNGNPFGGALIASRSGIATTPPSPTRRTSSA